MTYVIAEIGNNHEGQPEKLVKLTVNAIDAGADAVKYQIFNPDTLVDSSMPAMVGEGTQIDRLRKLQLKMSVYKACADICHDNGVEVVVSPFDNALVKECQSFTDKFKIASGEIVNTTLMRALDATGKDIILSTGMSTYEELHWAVNFFPHNKLSILHCVSLYPCPHTEANLSKISYLKRTYPNHKIGYSDHCVGSAAAIMSVTLGAVILEKHFTDSPERDGDHCHSLTKKELQHLVQTIKLMKSMLVGNAEADFKMRKFLRRGKNRLRGG